MSLHRRQLLQHGIQASVSGLLVGGLWNQVATVAQAQQVPAPHPALKYPYELPKLPFETKALEPHIDTKTMEIHHGKHHQAYVDNLNKAIKEYPDLQAMTLHDLLRKIKDLPEAVRPVVRNHGGGHLNHSMFWSIMRANGVHGAGAAPKGDLATAIAAEFGDLEKFKTAFNEAGTKLFGSGWVVLALEAKTNKLKILSQPNQDSPLMEGHTTLLGNDVWEHAYYLNYQNRRADYLKAWWNVLAWDLVANRYTAAKAGHDI